MTKIHLLAHNPNPLLIITANYPNAPSQINILNLRSVAIVKLTCHHNKKHLKISTIKTNLKNHLIINSKISGYKSKMLNRRLKSKRQLMNKNKACCKETYKNTSIQNPNKITQAILKNNNFHIKGQTTILRTNQIRMIKIKI